MHWHYAESQLCADQNFHFFYLTSVSSSLLRALASSSRDCSICDSSLCVPDVPIFSIRFSCSNLSSCSLQPQHHLLLTCYLLCYLVCICHLPVTNLLCIVLPSIYTSLSWYLHIKNLLFIIIRTDHSYQALFSNMS